MIVFCLKWCFFLEISKCPSEVQVYENNTRVSILTLVLLSQSPWKHKSLYMLVRIQASDDVSFCWTNMFGQKWHSSDCADCQHMMFGKEYTQPMDTVSYQPVQAFSSIPVKSKLTDTQDGLFRNLGPPPARHLCPCFGACGVTSKTELHGGHGHQQSNLGKILWFLSLN